MTAATLLQEKKKSYFCIFAKSKPVLGPKSLLKLFSSALYLLFFFVAGAWWKRKDKCSVSGAVVHMHLIELVMHFGIWSLSYDNPLM